MTILSRSKLVFSTVLYRSKMNPNLNRNFALDWIAEITAHIPTLYQSGGSTSDRRFLVKLP